MDKIIYPLLSHNTTLPNAPLTVKREEHSADLYCEL